MTDLLCRVCDSDKFDNKDELHNYLAIQGKKIDKSIYKKIIIDNIDIDEVDNILCNFVEVHNKKFNIFFIKCCFNIRFTNINIDLESNNVFNLEIYKIFIELLYFIDCMQTQEKYFIKINQMTINFICDICNVSEEYSNHLILNPIGRQMNIIFSKKPHLLDDISNNNLIRKKSHII